MQFKRPWLTLFAAGLALIVVTSATTAILMNARYQALDQSAESERAASLAASGQTQESSQISVSPSESAATQPSVSQTTSSTESLSTVQSDPTLPASSTTAAPTTARPATTQPASTTRTTTAGTTKSATSANQYITADQARKIILDRIHTTGLQVVETQLESSDYPPKYEIKLIDSQYTYEAEIHAITGYVIEIEKEARS